MDDVLEVSELRDAARVMPMPVRGQLQLTGTNLESCAISVEVHQENWTHFDSRGKLRDPHVPPNDCLPGSLGAASLIIGKDRHSLLSTPKSINRMLTFTFTTITEKIPGNRTVLRG